jgi:hypothetical protein
MERATMNRKRTRDPTDAELVATLGLWLGSVAVLMAVAISRVANTRSPTSP